MNRISGPWKEAPVLTIDPGESVFGEQVPAADEQASPYGNKAAGLIVYGILGVLFGVVLVKSEVVSWFRIQEMFRFDSFHMYGIMGSAVLVAALSLQLIKRLQLRTLQGEPIAIPPKEWGSGTRYWAGGLVFGFGWALLGACPGPVYALLGSGITVMALALLSALAGTVLYGVLRPYLPH